ncbi:MAG TPA: cytochrome c biogenesis protein ResB [Microbacteriaceae bacterium]|nr:cytochrome c biogenesis protein ResB [Microbacteriaceae bacterium]
MASSRPFDYDDGSGGSVKAASPDLGLKGWLRWFWRQLTSMRVALILLLMLAIATIPGSLFPQRSADPNGVIIWQDENPELFKILDAYPLQLFDVYGSIWFSAIYLLLFISLIGCVLPRIGHHWKALRNPPPKTPARLNRMAGYKQIFVSNEDATEEEKEEFARRAVQIAHEQLRSQGYRVETQTREFRGAKEKSASAERGYMRETGNLVFHLGLLGVLLAVGINSSFNFHGQRVVVEEESGMLNALIDFDSATSGRYFDTNSLEPWGLRLDNLEIDYVTPESGNQAATGQVLQHRAYVTIFPVDDDPYEDLVLVNHPLRTQGASVYLLANGYAPTITIRDSAENVVFRESVPFIPQDTNMTSLGVIKVPDGFEEQLGFRGFFYPTQAELDTGALTSSYPDLNDPLLTLDLFVGDLGIDGGIPQSVYALDSSDMEQLTGRAVNIDSLELTVGETVDLPNGFGTITLEAVPRYVSFDFVSNPAQAWVLVFALVATFGLLSSLFIPRRRMWVKAKPQQGGVLLEYAALARGDDPTLDRAVTQFSEAHQKRL